MAPVKSLLVTFGDRSVTISGIVICDRALYKREYTL